MSAAPEIAGSGSAPLTFRQWLRDLDRYTRRPSLLGGVLAVGVPIVTVVLSVSAIDWLFPVDGLDGRARDIANMRRVLLPLVGGIWALLTMILTMPDNRRDAIRICPIALLAGAAGQAGMAGAWIVPNALADTVPAILLWFSLPVALAAALVGGVAALFAAWRFRPSMPVVRPPRPDSRQELATIFIALPASMAAGIGFGFIDQWLAPAGCDPAMGAAMLGFMVVMFNGIDAARAWCWAGPLRGALFMRCGAGLSIALAALPLGRIFGCGEVWMVDRFDWAVISGIFGGRALPVYLVAGLLAWWQMEHFLARHGLRWQDRVDEGETP